MVELVAEIASDGAATALSWKEEKWDSDNTTKLLVVTAVGTVH